MQIDSTPLLPPRKRFLEESHELEKASRHAPVSIKQASKQVIQSLKEYDIAVHNAYCQEIPHAALPIDVINIIFNFGAIASTVNYASTCKRAREVFLSSSVIKNFYNRPDVQKLDIETKTTILYLYGKNLTGVCFHVPIADEFILDALEKVVLKHPKTIASIHIKRLFAVVECWKIASLDRVNVEIEEKNNEDAIRKLDYLLLFPYNSRGVIREKYRNRTKKEYQQQLKNAKYVKLLPHHDPIEKLHASYFDPKHLSFFKTKFVRKTLNTLAAIHWHEKFHNQELYDILHYNDNPHSRDHYISSPLEEAILGIYKSHFMTYRWTSRGAGLESIEHFKRALEDDPSQPLALKHRGSQYFAMKNYHLALQDLSLAHQELPNDFEIIFQLGRIYMHLKNDEKATDYFTRAIEIKPKDPYPYEKRAILYFRQGKYQEAIKDANKAKLLEPFNDHIKAFIGTCYYELGDNKEAMAYLKDYKKEFWHDNLGLLCRAKILFKFEKLQTALGDLNELLKDDPKDFEALKLRAEILYLTDHYDAAIRDCNQIIYLDSTHFEAYYIRSRVFTAKGEPQYAITDINLSLQRNPDNAELYHWRSYNDYLLENYQEALKDCDKALTINPNFSASYVQRAQVLHALGKNDEAIKDFKKALELEPAEADHYHNFVECLIEQEKIEEAKKLLANGLKKARSDRSLLYLSHALMKAMQQEFKKANQDFTRVCSNIKKYAFYHARLGRIYCLQKKYDLAKRELEKAQALNPYNKEVKYLKKMLKL